MNLDRFSHLKRPLSKVETGHGRLSHPQFIKTILSKSSSKIVNDAEDKDSNYDSDENEFEDDDQLGKATIGRKTIRRSTIGRSHLVELPISRYDNWS